MKKIFIVLVISILIVGTISVWYLNRNSYSKETLKVEIIGPEKIIVGDEIEYIVKFKNNGEARLEDIKLVFEYPQYSEPEEGFSLREVISSDELETIYPGEEKTISFKGKIFGKEGETRTAKVLLSYSPNNLNTTYESQSSLTSVIKEVPLTFNFDIPSKIESNDQFDFRINYFSNMSYPVSDLIVKIYYPDGFEFISSSPSTLEKTEWELGSLNKADGGRIEIDGRLIGDVRENKIFRGEIGIWREGEFVLLKNIVQSIEIVEPSIYIIQQINNNPQYIASPGDILHYEIFFRNIGRKSLEKLFLIIKLKGDAFDFDTLKSEQGIFESGDNSVIFDWRKVSELQFLEDGEEGMVEFWIELKDGWSVDGDTGTNPVIINAVYLSQARKEFITKVNSKIDLIVTGYSNNISFGEEGNEVQFTNSGNNPPRVGDTTTYVISWDLQNYLNDVNNVKIKAKLSDYVSLTGKIFPNNCNLTFDSNSKEIVWNVGNIEIGTGISSEKEKKQCVFQVSVIPTENRSVTNIIENILIEGEDQFTGGLIEQISDGLSIDSEGNFMSEKN